MPKGGQARAKAFTSARIVCLLASLNRPACYDRTNSAIIAGAVVSKPTTSSMPRSFESVTVKPLEVMPQ